MVARPRLAQLLAGSAKNVVAGCTLCVMPRESYRIAKGLTR